jgi:hypothetical protein
MILFFLTLNGFIPFKIYVLSKIVVEKVSISISILKIVSGGERYKRFLFSSDSETHLNIYS